VTGFTSFCSALLNFAKHDQPISLGSWDGVGHDHPILSALVPVPLLFRMFIPLLLLGIGWYLASLGSGLDKTCDGLTMDMADQ
jgi:hypothetical protein